MKGWGPKSSIWPSKPGKSNFFGGISRDFAGISRGCPKSLRKKSLGSIFVPYKPHPCNMPQVKEMRCSFRKVALQKLHCNIRFSAVQTSFLPKAALQQTESRIENFEKDALQDSGAFLPLPSGFQAPTFRLPGLGLAEWALEKLPFAVEPKP